MTSITQIEISRLAALEQTIERGKQTFVEVGLALAEIRDGKLYRSEFASFEEYVQSKWGWTKQHAYRLIESAPVAKSNPRVTSAKAAHELSKVEPEAREEVVERAASKGAVTAKSIKSAAAELSPEPDNSEISFPEDKPEAARNDAAWKDAVGISDARQFFAAQIEDVASGAIESATIEQLQAAKLAAQVAIKKFDAAIAARRVQE